MRVYACRIEFGPFDGCVEAIASATRSWLAAERRFGAGVGGADLATPWRGTAEDRTISVDTIGANSDRLWACQFSLHDRERVGRRWVTEIGVQITQTVAACSVFTDIETTDHTVSMQRFAITRPQVVLELAKLLQHHTPERISDSPKQLTFPTLKQFDHFLKAPERRLPIVLSSLYLKSERSLVDVERLASLLAGIAHVYVYDNKFTGLEFSKLVKNEWSVWDGAVRIYWPFRPDNQTPFQHRRWMQWHLDQLQMTAGPEDAIFRYVCRNACLLPTNMLIRLDDVSVRRSRLRVDELARTASDVSSLRELAATYEVLLKEKEEQISEANMTILGVRGENAALHSKLEESRQENARLRQITRELYEHEKKELPDEVREPIEVIVETAASVGDVVQLMQDEYKDRLVFTPAAVKDANDSQFENHAVCARALHILATLYWAMKRNLGVSPDDFKTALAEFGIEYSPHFSEVTAGRFGKEYERKYKNRKADFSEHLRLGRAWDPRRSMRIHFMWDNDELRVAIFYCGWHSKTQR